MRVTTFWSAQKQCIFSLGPSKSCTSLIFFARTVNCFHKQIVSIFFQLPFVCCFVSSSTVDDYFNCWLTLLVCQERAPLYSWPEVPKFALSFLLLFVLAFWLHVEEFVALCWTKIGMKASGMCCVIVLALSLPLDITAATRDSSGWPGMSSHGPASEPLYYCRQ